jgi:polyisoprenoid-binding protein YceI
MHRRSITIATILTTLACLTALAASASLPDTVTYTLAASRSKFMAHASPSGLLWFKGHGHHLNAGDFTGMVELTPQTITPASLRLVVKAASLHETGTDFTEPQKQIINKELREIVLHPDQYPDIVFQSTTATAKAAKTGGGYDVKLTGNLTLHGVTRTVEIPCTVTLNGDEMRAIGKFSIDRDDFKVKATSAAHGLVRVSNKVKFEFDIVGRRQ